MSILRFVNGFLLKKCAINDCSMSAYEYVVETHYIISYAKNESFCNNVMFTTLFSEAKIKFKQRNT